MQPILANLLPYLLDDTGTNGITGDDQFCGILAVPVGKVYAVMVMFTVFLAFAGLLMAAYKVQMGGDLSGLGTQLVMTVLVAVAVGNNNLPRWFLDAEVALAEGLPSALGFSVKQFMLDFTAELGLCTIDAMIGMYATMLVAGIFGFGMGFIASAIVAAIMIAIAWIICAICWLGVVLAYLLQIAVVYISLSLAPLFLGMLLFEKTRETGTKYFMGIIGVLFWPLGWSLGFLILDAMIDPINRMFFAEPIAIALQIMNALLGGVLAAGLACFIGGMVWALLTKAPKVISEAITAGGQIGAGLVGAAAGGGASAASGAFSTGAGAVMMGASMAAGGAGGGASKGAAIGGGGGGGGGGGSLT